MSRLFPLLLITGLMLSCATTGPGGKRSLILIPTGREVAIGAGMAEQVSQSETTLADSAWQRYVNEVGQKLVAVSDRRDIKYHFTVIESDQINAFAAPGGYLYFYTGLLRLMDNEAEMAAVIAHEISHVVGRHGIKRLQKAMGFALAYQLAFGGGGSEAVDAAIGVGMGLMFAGYSRNAEREADNFGIGYMVKAGYDPEGAVTMFEKLAASGGKGSSNVFEKMTRSHPETAERINNAKKQILSGGTSGKQLILGEDRYQKMRARLPEPKKKKGNKIK